ncbi:hypothetical protein FRC19_006221 [Serendipita sp. 401]|nr:hypothetical protein FRC19_006221 [Serendipita sp. 401]
MKQHYTTLPNGRTYHFVDEPPVSGATPRATLFCFHGFPDQWYGWKHQIVAWSNAGYRVIVPHMLGYGSTDKPSDPSAYSTKNLTNDLALLLDALQLPQVVVIGHDWGAAVAWRFALWHPDRLTHLITMSVPYFPPSKTYIPPSEASKRVPTFAYQEYFANTASTRDIESNLDTFLLAVFQSPNATNFTPSQPISSNEQNSAGGFGASIPFVLKGQMQALLTGDKSKIKHHPTVVSNHELERYHEDFSKGGMNGPLSYYRNTRSRFDDERAAGSTLGIRPNLPVLFMFGTKDSTCPKGFVDRMSVFVRDLKVVTLEDVGHWVLIEAKERTTEEVLNFLEERKDNVGLPPHSRRLLESKL